MSTPEDNGPPTTLRSVKKGDYVRFTATGKSTWIKGHYCPSVKSFSMTHTEDSNREVFRKPSATCFVGFTY